MIARISVPLLLLAGTVFGDVKVVVELVPDNPGPYTGGESLTVHVWLHSEVAFDAFLYEVRLDFLDSDPGLSLDATFTFDLSAIPKDIGAYGTVPELPVPVVWVMIDGPLLPENLLPLRVGGSLHIGSIGVRVPGDPGIYRLDVLNVDEPDELRGARILATFFPGGALWRAFTGEITDGTSEFVVVPNIPTVSEWGVIVMTLLLLVVGSLTIMRPKRSITRNTLVTAFLTLLLGQASGVARDRAGGVALNVRRATGSFELSLGHKPPFHVTEREVANARLVDVADSTVRIAL